ncbi:MAG: glycosyltransferase family 2 protein [Christensenellales bacterium]|jgi:glycosyltransferase involved in cell wall biosynthesis
MRHRPSVSIVTPCYNASGHIERYLDSVWAQTYAPMELILVNDGSTDGTETLCLSYAQRFEQAGIRFVYLSQQNKGQAAALNRGLKHIKGDYILWPDADDILHPEHVAHKVAFLEAHPACGLVMCRARMVHEEDVHKVIGQTPYHPERKDKLFTDLIEGKYANLCNGLYMLRTKHLLQVNPGLEIYENRAGQNWQMLLPMAYHFPCGYLDEFLYDYVVRKESHSHKSFSEPASALQQLSGMQDILQHVIENMDIDQKEGILKGIREQYARKKLALAGELRDTALADAQKGELTMLGRYTFFDRLRYLAARSGMVRALISAVKRLKGLKRA